jgi:hypothetical protein
MVSLYDPVIDNPFYSRISNRNGNFFIGEKAYKITKDGIYTSEKGNLKDLEAMASGRESKVEGVEFTSNSESLNLKSVQNCGVSVIDLDKANSDNDRIIRFIVSTGFTYSTVSGNYPAPYIGNYTITCKTRSYKKFLGAWILYGTIHFIDGFNAKVLSPAVSNAVFQWTDTYPYYSPQFTLNSSTLPYSFTSSDVSENIWKENEEIGRKIYFQSIGDVTSVVSPLISYLDISVWSRGVPPEQKLTKNYNCN